MASRRLTKEERRQAYYDEPYAWHIIGTNVYHVCPNCPAGHDLTLHHMKDFLCGTGGRARCSTCTNLLKG